MRRTIQVLIGETPVRVGVIHYDSQGARESAAFEYASEWLASSDAFALAPDLRLSILITNVDDHLRNHGFLHVDHGLWRLAPAFDLNPFPDRVRELKTWISEETGPAASIEALMSVARYFRLVAERAGRIVGEVEAAVARWRDEGRSLGMSAVELDQFAEAFEHNERNVARKLGAS